MVGCTQPVTKHNYLVRDVHEIPHVVKEAYYVAIHGPPGAGADRYLQGAVQQANWDDPEWTQAVDLPGYHPGRQPVVGEVLDAAAAALERAQRPADPGRPGVLFSGAAAASCRRSRRRLWCPPGPPCSGSARSVQHPLASHDRFMAPGWN